MSYLKNILKFSSYGDYSSKNYGVNALVFTDINNVDYYFSYNTLVAFNHSSTGLVIMKNYWGNTTGKHLNWIDRDKTIRVDEDIFYNRLDELKSRLVINVPVL
jgi:hypothetical protein|tara:strand:+ start:153 stop:461 length:309 start_codon:yes stop_codon:yes gene_type:complete